MSKVIDEKINKEINTGLVFNYATKKPIYTYILPKFEKNAKGEYFFVGNCTISTLKEYRAYMRTYREIAESLKKMYRPVIGRIYRNALNSLVADSSKFRLEDNAYSLSSKLYKAPFDAGTVKDNSSSEYKKTLSYLTKAAFKSKRLQPCKEINDIIRSASGKTIEDASQICVLPVMTDNGVVLTQKKQNKNAIEAQFQVFTWKDATEIENYILSATRGLDEATASKIKEQISKVFKDAFAIGESVKAGLNSNIAERLEKLSSDFIDLIGVDLSNFSKGDKIVRTAPKSSEVEESVPEEPVQSSAAINDQKPSVTATGAQGSGKKAYYANEIMMDGEYKTAPAIEDGRIVTRLTPEGMRFVVTLKNNKLVVANEQSNEEGFAQF